jgi:hypothetical protein
VGIRLQTLNYHLAGYLSSSNLAKNCINVVTPLSHMLIPLLFKVNVGVFRMLMGELLNCS